jgi:hypothetical protein
MAQNRVPFQPYTYMTIFIPQKFRRQRNIREIGSGIKRSLPPCFYSMPDIFCFQILLFRMRRGTPDKELRNAGISEWFFQIPADASKVEGRSIKWQSPGGILSILHACPICCPYFSVLYFIVKQDKSSSIAHAIQ